MANWWDADPVVAPAQTAAATNWWEADPVAEQAVPTPPSRVETPPEIVKSLAESGKGTRTSIALGGAKVPEDIPLPNVAPEGGAIDRTLTAVGDIPEAAMRGYYGAKTGANILGLEAGVLTPEEAAANIAESTKKAQEVPMPESVRKGMEALQKATTWQETLEALKEHPDVLPSVLGESAASSLVSMGTGVLGALTGAVAGPVGATAGLAGGVGIGSAATEYAGTLNSFLIEKGYNTADPEQLKAAFSNPELMAEARKDAAIRGVAVGAFDALTAGVAGKLFGPVKGLFGKTPAGQVVGSVAGSTAEIGSQALGGAGGAAAGQLGTKGEITEPGEIALEAAGEIIPGLGEIAIGSMAQPKAAPAAEAPALPPAAAPPAPFEVTVRVPAIREGATPEGAAPVPSEAPTKEQAEDLEAVAILKGAGLDFDDITAMSSRQRKAEAKRFQEDQDVKPAELTQEEISFFTPQPEAPAAPPSPAPAVEAQGPEGVSPPPSVPPAAPVERYNALRAAGYTEEQVRAMTPEQRVAALAPKAPPAAPSEIATDLVQQGVPPLEAMQQAAEQRQATSEEAPVERYNALRAAGYTDGQIRSMTPEQRAAALAPAAPQPVPFSAPEAKKRFDTASTGKPFKATLIRGQGSNISPYNPDGAQEPILGQGLYTTHDKRYASSFGPSITEHQVDLKNPLVIDNDLQWKALTKRAGWKFPNPAGGDKQQISKDIANLRKMLVDEGHDGVVVLVPQSEMQGKTLQQVFGADQVVEFNAKKPAVAKKPVAEKPAPAAKAAPVKAEAPKKGSPRPFWRAGNMDTVIRNMGGIKDVGGELKARDVPRQLINNKRGRPLEEVALDLIERGYYPEFKVQLDNVRENSPDSYQPTPEMIEQIKNDIGKKKMHPSYQEDIEEARRLDEEKNIFGPYVEEAEKAAVALGIGKDDPMVRQVAQMVYNGQFENAEDAFRALLFTQIEDALPMEDLPELREAFGEENLADIEEFLALEGIAPLEADYVPEPSPVPKGRPISGEGREQGVEPEGEVAPEVAGREVEKPVSEQAKKQTKPKVKPAGREPDAGTPQGAMSEAQAQSILDKRMPEGYTVEFEDAGDGRYPLGTFLLISGPRMDKPARRINNRINLDDWIDQQKKISKASEDIGPEGKPQLVLPGAEKVSTKKQLEQKAAAPLKAKAKQKEPGPLFGQEHLQQDLFASVAPKPEAKPAAEQKSEKRQVPNWLKETSKNVGLKPVFGNEEVGLAYRSDDRGVIEYVGLHRKSDSRTRADIDLYMGSMFTSEEIAMLRDAKKREEEWSKEEIKKNPAGPFKNSNVVVSKNFPNRLGKVALEWLKIANLPPNVRVMFATEADAYDMDFAGDYRIISSPKTFMTPNTNGIKVAPKINKGVPLTIDRDYNLIILKDDMPITQTLEVLSHEIGHIIEDEVWKNTNDAMKQAVIDAHDAWAKKALKGKISDLFSGRPYKGQSELLKKYKNLLYDPADIAGNQEYWLSFSEWFADNTARWFMSEAKPLTVVDRFFKRLADALRKFYSKITNQKYAPDPDFKKWLDNYVKAESYDLVRDPQAVSPETIAREQRNTLDRSNTPTYTVPKEGFGSQFMYYLVDKYNDASSVQRAMEAARGSKLPDNLDVEMSIQLMQDKAIAKQQKFYDNMVRPMVAFMQAHKITGDEAGRFLYAQHAPERNLRMAQRDPSRFDGTNGSGLTTQEALDYIAEIPADRRALLERLYKDHVRKILDADLEYRVNNGLLTDEQYDSYTQPFDRGGYDHYVPLQGYAEDGSDLEPSEADPFIPNIGKGFAVWGKEYKLAAGRTSKAMNPLYSAIQKNMDGIVRVEKNKTDKVLYDLIRKNPNPEIATIHSDKDLPKRAVLRADGTIQYVPDFSLARAEETLPLKIGGRQHYIVFNRDNPTAKRLVHVLKGLTGDQMNIFSRALLATGRFMSNINTQWVPDFFITNMPRDVQDALISIYSNKEGFATNFVKEFMRSGNIVRKVAMKQPLSAEEQAHYDEWIDSGGRLDFGGFATIEKTAEKLQEEFGDLFDSGRTSAETLQRYFQKTGNATLGAVERFNQMFDDVVRFSVYRAARRDPNNRYTKERAAQLARRATVDFRQRGAAMPYVNALYPYLSAGINGQRNFLRVLKSRRGRTVLGSLMLLGIANSLLGLALSEDDETDPTKKKFYTQVNQWERAKSFIIPVPINGKYRKVSLGFMGLFVFGLGDQIVGYLSGNVKAGDAAVNVGTSLLSSFVPFWSGGAVDSVTPWVLQPVVELWTNKNWIGNPIYPDRDSRMPQSSQALSTTPDWAKSAAQLANDWSGGSHTQPGWVDVYPATLDYFAKFVTQGLGTFASASYEPFRAFMNGEDLNAEKLPVLRRVTTKDSADRSSYYDIRNDIKAGVAQARELRKIIMDPKADKEMKDDARATMRNLTKELGITFDADGVRVKNSIADVFDKTDDRLKKLNDEIKAIQSSDKYTTQEKAERVKIKEEAKKNIMNSARKRYLQKNKPPPSPIDEMLQ